MIRRDHKTAVAVCTGVTLLAAVLAFWWSTTKRYQLTGDEPHYFILAASLLRDGDVDVRNNFDEDAVTGEIYGPISGRHVQTYSGREYSNHAPGLSALLVLPFAVGGTVGGRLLLCFLITPILGWACWRWLEGRAPPGDVACIIAGVLLCPVILLGSGQVYGDLLAGVVIVALAVWLWNRVGRDEAGAPQRRSPVAWMLFGLIAGLLPWLHMKYLAVTALFGLFGAWQIWIERPWRYASSRSPWWGYASAGAFLLIGPATFLAFQMATHGRLLAGLGDELTRTPYLRALEFLIGNHLDQAQGLFWHQPLLLFGVVALGWMMRVRHRLTIPWLLLYGALMAPPALLAEWGGIPLGRLNWGGMWALAPSHRLVDGSGTNQPFSVHPSGVAGSARVPGDGGVALDSESDGSLPWSVLKPGLGARFTVPAAGSLHPSPLLSPRRRRLVDRSVPGVPTQPDLARSGRVPSGCRMDVERERTASTASRLGNRSGRRGSATAGRTDRGPGWAA